MAIHSNKRTIYYVLVMAIFIALGVFSFINGISALTQQAIALVSDSDTSLRSMRVFYCILEAISILVSLITVALAIVALTPQASNKKTQYFSGIFALRSIGGFAMTILGILASGLGQNTITFSAYCLQGFTSASFIIGVVEVGLFIAAYCLRYEKVTWQVLSYAAIGLSLVTNCVANGRSIGTQFNYGANGITISVTISQLIFYIILDVLALIDVHNQPYELSKKSE